MRKNKATLRKASDNIFTYVALIVMSAIFLFPCLWLILASLSKTGSLYDFKGFFPAEWVSLNVQPAEGDVLQLDNVQANVLASGSRGDISATVLHTGDASQTQRDYVVECYVFGRKITLEGTAQ